jgi:hypothetical protein
MRLKTFNKVRRQKDLRKFYNEKGECYQMARDLRQKYPELTHAQALASAYVMSGKGILGVSKLKIQS